MIYGLLIRTRFEVRKPLTFGNWLIRRKLKHDHFAALFWKNGKWKVAEMKFFAGYTETDYEEWIEQYDREIDMEVLDCTIEDIRAHKGKKYDLASTCWALPVYILTGKWIGRRHKAAQKLFCFEQYAILKKHPEFWLYMPGFETKR
jgi:hypothetical protein